MKKDWFKDRGYPHFSNKTPASVRKRVLKYISNPNLVAKHSFLPLIYKEITQRRYKNTFIGNSNRRSHKKIDNGTVSSNKKIRKILYSSHLDSHIYSFYSQQIITPKYESLLERNKELSKCITAYRKISSDEGHRNKNNVDFAKDVFEEIKRRGECVTLVLDIENFFPSLDHQILKQSWSKLFSTKSLSKDHYNIFKSITNFSYVRLSDLRINKRYFDEKLLAKNKQSGTYAFFKSPKELFHSKIIVRKNQVRNPEKNLIGIPQGLPISALLANIYMYEFDKSIFEQLVIKFGIFYRRYSDDIILICNLDQIEEVEKVISSEIEKIKLHISLEKTEKNLFKYKDGRLQSYKIEKEKLIEDIPLNYLGFEFYGYQTLIKSKNIANFYREMKSAVRRKSNRAEKIAEKELQDEKVLFKRKLYRQFSYKGHKSRVLPRTNKIYRHGKYVSISVNKKFRGNYLRYVYRSADIMDAPEIKRQLNRHWKILQTSIAKHDFNNSN